MTKAELQIELARVTSRSDAHWQNYLDALRRIDVLAVELREAREALQRIADCDWPGPLPLVPSRADWMQNIAKEALE